MNLAAEQAMQDDIREVKETLNSLTAALIGSDFGEGRIPRLERRVEGLDKRMKVLEKFYWKVGGVFAAIGGVFGAVGAWFHFTSFTRNK